MFERTPLYAWSPVQAKYWGLATSQRHFNMPALNNSIDFSNKRKPN